MPAIQLDDMSVEVDRDIWMIYNQAMASAAQTLAQYVRVHGTLVCAVRHPMAKEDPTLFTVHVECPRALGPGVLRGSLRLLLEDANDGSFESRKTRDELCSLFGAQWHRLLIERSALVEWLNGRSYSYRYPATHYEGLRVLSKTAAFQIKLMWVDI